MVGGTFEAWNAGSDDGPAFSFALERDEVALNRFGILESARF